jgi:hypothetical protein
MGVNNVATCNIYNLSVYFFRLRGVRRTSTGGLLPLKIFEINGYMSVIKYKPLKT